MSQGAPTSVLQSPEVKHQIFSVDSPPQDVQSPTKSTPSSIKAVKVQTATRDHTTDKLNPGGDEFEPRDIDEDGDKKISPLGAILGGRTYAVPSFTLQSRGDKIFMLATRCAQHLAYRDSYLLFNKNRSLFKIIANQKEKEEMIAKEVIPYAYRSRQIAIVTARSMFRHFGARIVKDGHKVRDDYFEARARAQGFTEEDPAWLKRPGDVKHKEAPVANDISSIGANALLQLERRQIIYKANEAAPDSQVDLHLTGEAMPSTSSDDSRPIDYGDMQRPRQDITGVPYADRTQASTEIEVVNQAAQAVQFNAQIRHARNFRTDYLNNEWQRVHEIDEAPTDAQALGGAKLQDQLQDSMTYASPRATRSTPAANLHAQQSGPAQTPGSATQPNSFVRPLMQMQSSSPGAHTMQSNVASQPPQQPNYGYNAQPPMTNFGFPSAPPQNIYLAGQMQHASPMQRTPQQSHYGSNPSRPSPSPHPIQQSPHPPIPQPSQQGPPSNQSQSISSLGGYQGNGIPGMQPGPLSQPYLAQQQQRSDYGSNVAGMMRAGGYAANPANQQYMQQQGMSTGNINMGSGLQGWDARLGGMGTGQQAQQALHGAQSQSQGGWPGQAY